MSRSTRILLASALVVTLGACAGPGIRSGEPVQFTEPRSRPAGDDFPNWPHPPLTELEEVQEFDRSAHRVEGRDVAGGGVTGAGKIDIRWDAPGAQVLLKFKRAPDGRLDGWNNAPRKELAAYEIQQLFLDPVDFVVPTTQMYCVSMDRWEAEFGPSEPSVPGIPCVMVNLSWWLRDVTLPDELYDEQRFLTDADYAWYLANFNIVTYLINQRDGRRGNFLVAKDDTRRIVFSIDNGVSFGANIYNWFNPPSFAWTKIRVPALPRQAVDRLRKLRRTDLDPLMVVNQLEPNAKGVLRHVAPGPAIEPEKGVTIQGTTVQMGLTRREVDDVWERITALIEAVDDGRMPVF